MITDKVHFVSVSSFQSSRLHVIKDLIQGVRMSTMKLKQQVTLWVRGLSWERRTKHYLGDCCPLSSAASFRKDENFELFNFPFTLNFCHIYFSTIFFWIFIACNVHKYDTKTKTKTADEQWTFKDYFHTIINLFDICQYETSQMTNLWIHTKKFLKVF